VKEKLFVDYLPVEELAIAPGNAIAQEHDDFFAAIKNGGAPIVSGQAGRSALAVAQRILSSISYHLPLRKAG
jgi:hypothetical protein